LSCAQGEWNSSGLRQSSAWVHQTQFVCRVSDTRFAPARSTNQHHGCGGFRQGSSGPLSCVRRRRRTPHPPAGAYSLSRRLIALARRRSSSSPFSIVFSTFFDSFCASTAAFFSFFSFFAVAACASVAALTAGSCRSRAPAFSEASRVGRGI